MKHGQIVKFNGELGEAVTDNNRFYFHPVNYGNYTCSNLQEITEETIEPITFDEKILYIQRNFKWGPVVKTHTIGEYQIIEYISNDVVRFYTYINFNSCNTSYTSLDAALIGVIATNGLDAYESRYATTCILRILKKPGW